MSQDTEMFQSVDKDNKEGVISFDDVLDTIGGFKFYQKWLFVLVSVPNLITGLFLLNPAFLLATPDHRCQVPGYENDTYEIQDDFHRCLVNSFVPVSTDGTYDSCHVYVTRNPITLCQNTSSTEGIINTTEKTTCSKWVYDTSVYEKTFVSQKNLVCDRTVWVANGEMLFYGGMLLGSILSGVFSDMYGRKMVMYISFWTMTIASIVLAFCEEYWQFVLVNFIQGASIIGSFMPAFIISFTIYAFICFLAMEITSVSKRMWPGIASNIAYLLGLMGLSTVAYFERSWNKLALFTALPCLLLLPMWWLIPESPRWLLSKKRQRQAEVILKKAARWNGTSLPANILDSVRIEEEPSYRHFLEVFKSFKMLLITTITCFNWMVVSISYYGLSLNMSTIAGNYYLNFALSGLVEAPGYVIVLLLIDKIGRRRLYCLVMAISGVSLVSTFFTLYYGSEGKVTNRIVLVLTLIGKCGATAGFSIQYLYTVELFPTIIRNAGIGVSSLSARIGTMICPYIVILKHDVKGSNNQHPIEGASQESGNRAQSAKGKQMGGNLGKSFALVIIGVLSLLSTLISLLLPETLDQPMPETVEDIDRLGYNNKLNNKTTRQ